MTAAYSQHRPMHSPILAACTALSALISLTTSNLALAQSPNGQDGAQRANVSDQMTVAGSVKLPGGEPAAGAKVAVVARMKRPTRGGDLAGSDAVVLGHAVASGSGKFELKVARTS